MMHLFFFLQELLNFYDERSTFFLQREDLKAADKVQNIGFLIIYA